MMLVWWSLPECLWRLEGPRVDAGLVVTAGVSMKAGGVPRVDTGLVVTAGVFMEAGGGLELMLVLWSLLDCLWRLEEVLS